MILLGCLQQPWHISSRIGTNLPGIRSYHSDRNNRRTVVRTNLGDFLWLSSMHLHG